MNEKKSESTDPGAKNANLSVVMNFPEFDATRSRIKCGLKILCLAGLIYQICDTVFAYGSYPTDVSVRVHHPFAVEQPAITVCNKNLIRRSELCLSRPGQCTMFEEEQFRSMYGNYCPDTGKCFSGLPRINMYVVEKRNWEVTANLSHTRSLIRSCFKITDNLKLKCKLPYARVPTVTLQGDPNMCYTIESEWGEPGATAEIYPKSYIMELEFNTEPDEYLISTEPVLVQIAFHDRKRQVNAYHEGFQLKGGSIYQAFVSMTEKLLLPYPYDTNCRDYTELWRRNNGTGPLDDQMCVEQCKLNALLERNLCIDKNVAYPHWNKLCDKGVITTNSDIIDYCILECPQPCHDRTYEVLYEETSNYKKMCNSEWCRLQRTKLTVFFNRFRVTQYWYHPKITMHEAMVAIGGYMGVCVGIALLLNTVEIVICSPVHRLCKKTKSKIGVEEDFKY